MILDYQIGVILKQVPSSPISSGAHIHKQVTPHAIAENTIAFFLSVVGDFCVSKKNQKQKKNCCHLLFKNNCFYLVICPNLRGTSLRSFGLQLETLF